MFDDTPVRRWWPTEHEQARIERMRQDRGHYPNCRHYHKAGDRTFICKKNNTHKKACSGCMVCPNCGGMMYTYKMQKDYNRNHLFISHAKSCAICGADIEEHYVVACQQSKEPAGKENKCQVEGCRHTAYEGFTTDEIHAEGETYIICLTHKRRIKTWRLNTSKGEDQVPVVIIANKLYDNPNYEKKQGKRK